VQVLDQQVAPAWPVAEQRAYHIERGGIDLAALGPGRSAPLAAAGVTMLANLGFGFGHS